MYNYNYNKYIEKILDDMFMRSIYTEHEMCKLNKKIRNIIMKKIYIHPFLFEYNFPDNTK